MKNSAIFTIILAIALVSCTKQENLNRSDEKVALSVKAGISIEPSTKAIINGTNFVNGAAIGVQVLNATDAAYETGASTNLQFTATVSGEPATTSWATATPFYLTATQGKVYGYYPYTATVTGLGATATIPAIVSSTANLGSETDYMYSTPLTEASVLVSNASGKNAASLSMNHALAQVSFVVYKENYGGAGSLSQFTIKDATTSTWVKVSEETNTMAMAIANGGITGGTTGTITRNSLAGITIPSSSAVPGSELPATTPAGLRAQVNATTLVVPTTAIGVGDIQFTFTIDGKTSSVLSTSSIAWEAGKQYIYKVKLSGTGMSISNVTITDWSPVSGDDVNIQ